MKRVLLCEPDAPLRVKLRGAIERYAESCGVSNVEVIIAPNANVLGKALLDMRHGLFGLVVCSVSCEGALDVLRTARETDPGLRIVLVSRSEDDAMLAFDMQASLLVVPSDVNGFATAIGSHMHELGTDDLRTVAIKSTEGVSNLAIGDVLFVESAKKGPIIHVVDRSPVVARGTLTALGDRLVQADEERFMKVGGSFIVNLDNVRSAGESSVVFSDGEAIIVPVRMRKPLREALAAYLSE